MNQRLSVAVFASVVATVSPVNVLASEVASLFLLRKPQGSGSVHFSPEPWTMGRHQQLDNLFHGMPLRPEKVSYGEDSSGRGPAGWSRGGDCGFPGCSIASTSWLDQEQVDLDEDIELNALADDRLMDGQKFIQMTLSGLGEV
ncbi:hypothetical protein FLM9_1460 [Candidatus Synechococcus spongiarum]|uniref:Uncharacterized protein n=1 Tax=Candidatus Synechococcus spongiarum TaxID=431041 RepID=A0A164Z6I8_9SYNE|nr:hypothetical protein FLM9_1460 [Candidatus Synechococcus spongiarum]